MRRPIGTCWLTRNQQACPEAVGWSYETPTPRFVPITGYVSFMPGQIECFIDGERVLPQAGGFYGGWITADVVGPFKGEPGSWGW